MRVSTYSSSARCACNPRPDECLARGRVQLNVDCKHITARGCLDNITARGCFDTIVHDTRQHADIERDSTMTIGNYGARPSGATSEATDVIDQKVLETRRTASAHRCEEESGKETKDDDVIDGRHTKSILSMSTMYAGAIGEARGHAQDVEPDIISTVGARRGGVHAHASSHIPYSVGSYPVGGWRSRMLCERRRSRMSCDRRSSWSAPEPFKQSSFRVQTSQLYS